MIISQTSSVNKQKHAYFFTVYLAFINFFTVYLAFIKLICNFAAYITINHSVIYEDRHTDST